MNSPQNKKKISVVGGIYHEWCMRPHWDDVYGSAGRSAIAISRMGVSVTLHSYLGNIYYDFFSDKAALEGIALEVEKVNEPVEFLYHHGLEAPRINQPSKKYPSLSVKEENVVFFGMLEADAIIDSEYVVYDPQSPVNPLSFGANGSKAKHLALILNRHEARVLSGLMTGSVEELAQSLSASEHADVVIIKMGAEGAFVFSEVGSTSIPAFETGNVWKIGSGDTFVAHFAHAWICEGATAVEAARMASRATAYYCEKSNLPTKRQLSAFRPEEIKPSKRYCDGYRPTVYLASPFFNLSQRWMVEQARANLLDMGLKVFSPYHDVGPGSAEEVVHLDLKAIDDCDLMFAIGDGLDTGTIYEIGYARAKEKPVIVYMENESEEDRKMIEGSGCVICEDYVTSIYKLLWRACAL